MNSLRDAIDRVEGREQTLEVHTDEDAVAAELAAQFSTRNVRVRHHPLPDQASLDFVMIRNADGGFKGAVDIDHFRALLSPEIHPPWALDDSDTHSSGLFGFLDETIFTSYDRRQMLATAREIEERAWRTNAGTLYVGFQNSDAFKEQVPIYNRIATERNIEVVLLIDDEWDGEVSEVIEIVSDAADEIGTFWLVVFDGGDSELSKCGLVAEERDPGRYYGFWTYDPEFVSELIEYLEARYRR